MKLFKKNASNLAEKSSEAIGLFEKAILSLRKINDEAFDRQEKLAEEIEKRSSEKLQLQNMVKKNTSVISNIEKILS